MMPFEEAKYKEARASLYAKFKYINEYLTHHTYLAGESLTVADISLVSWAAPLFWTVFDESFRKGHSALVRWYKHILSFAPVKKFFRSPFMCKT